MQKRKDELSIALKEYRREHSMSQEELAQVIGTTIFTINRWERKKHYPPKSTLKLMKILGVITQGSL